jgi:putative flippase GtrA
LEIPLLGMTTKKDLAISLVIGEIIAWLIWPVWMNLNVLQDYWQWRWALLIIVPVLVVLGVIVANFIGKWLKVFQQLAKYGLVGVLNTLLDFSVLNLLSYTFSVYSKLSLVLINVISFLAANINSYFWNKYWTFQSGNKKIAGEFLKFFLVSVIGFLLNSGVLWFFTTMIKPAFGLSPQVWLNVVKLVATVIYLIWNFVGYKLIVFKEKSTNETSV